MVKKNIALTPREREILVYLVDGLTSVQIAEKLGISRRTVEKHRENMMVKMNVKNIVQLVVVVAKKSLL